MPQRASGCEPLMGGQPFITWRIIRRTLFDVVSTGGIATTRRQTPGLILSVLGRYMFARDLSREARADGSAPRLWAPSFWGLGGLATHCRVRPSHWRVRRFGVCGRGGIGRHTRFRFWRPRPWGFKSLRPHQRSVFAAACQRPPPRRHRSKWLWPRLHRDSVFDRRLTTICRSPS